MELAPDYYFITTHQLEDLLKAKEKEGSKEKHLHGTVGAVACDKHGNIAAATSTGGTANCKEGRIGDSSMIGIGCYANNSSCAVSTTGDGEYCMRAVLGHDISAVVEYKGLPLEEAVHYVIHVKNKDVKGDLGAIAVNAEGQVAFGFNSERMHRAWKTGEGEVYVKIYKD
jgi:beta-aspartyl-peptidase (threonine type)